MDVSQSMDRASPRSDKKAPAARAGREASGSKGGPVDMGKSQSVQNKQYDEALEFSQSGSDDSVDTKGEKGSRAAGKTQIKTTKPESTAASSLQGTDAGAKKAASIVEAPASKQEQPSQSQVPSGANRQTPQAVSSSSAGSSSNRPAPAAATAVNKSRDEEDDDEEEEEEEDDEDDDAAGESYENIEGAYKAKDYASLNVSAEVRDLFQYIERFKPTEMELETTLKCFIPEYIPAIGEMDAFIKVPRPDNKEDGLGLKFLDEPAASQSDPTVLELQLRAMSKKLQYGDVSVRSIEQAAKNPALVDKWIQNIKSLHRSKPPPQVHYKRNMPDMDSLLDMWPAEFERALETLPLPSPDLDLSLPEYAKTLCAILDIPTYENPIESLHLMFTLFMDFRNNPHFQARMASNQRTAEEKPQQNGYRAMGGADVMEITQG